MDANKQTGRFLLQARIYPNIDWLWRRICTLCAMQQRNSLSAMLRRAARSN